jgi:hypothetical protein
MASDRPRTLCPTCGEAIEPEDTTVIEAVERLPAPTFGDPGDAVEGLRYAFHEECWDEGDPLYRRVDRPE